MPGARCLKLAEAEKLVPSFPPLLHGLYKAFPWQFCMLVHMFIHTAKMTISNMAGFIPRLPTGYPQVCPQPLRQ
jgi:hypothetical protein